MSKFNPLLWRKPPEIWGYGIAVLSVSAVLLISRWPPLHLEGAPASLFLCAIVISAWLGGVGPGLLALVLSCLAFNYYFLNPLYSFAVKPEEIPRIVIFGVSALIAGSLSAAQRSATESLRSSRDYLTETVKELHRTNDALQEESRERVNIENRLRRSEGYLAEAQRLTHTGSFGWSVQSGEIRWSDETFRIFGCNPNTKPTLEVILQRTHPDDVAFVKERVERVSQEQKDLDFEHRLLMQDGSIKYLRAVAHAVRDNSGEIEFVGAVTDITAAKESEDRIRLIIDAVPAQIWTETPEGVVDYVNRRWIEYTGMTLEEAVGSGWNRMVHPDDIERVTTKWRKLIAEGRPREIESRLRRHDGEYRWFLSRCYPLVDRSGHILGWYGSDTDIHDRKQAEETLRRSEGYLAEAQRLSHTGSWASSPATGEIKYLSEECCRVLGFDPHGGQPRYETFIQRIVPEDQTKVREAVETAGRENSQYEMDYRIIHPGGGIRDIHVIGHPVLSPSGDVVEFVGTVIDITERKRAEESLRRSEGYLAEAQRLSHTGSWAWKPATGEITYLSEECYRVLGFDPQTGQPRFETFFKRIHPDDQPSVAKTLERAKHERAEFELSNRIVYPGGEIRDVHVVGHPVLSPSGDVVEFVGTMMDVTERKRAEEERERLRQAQADLARVNRVTTMGELTASLAHEVNQPIAAAVTNANTCLRWLAADTPNLEEARAAAMRIVKDGTRAAEIISRVRLLFKKGTPQRELVDVNEVVREMIVISAQARPRDAEHSCLGRNWLTTFPRSWEIACNCSR